MKIVQIGSYPIKLNIVGGGIEASVQGLSSELSKDHDVVVLDFPRNSYNHDFIEKGDFPIYRFCSKNGGYFSKVLRVFSYVKNVKMLKPDVVHIHSTTLFSFVLYLFLRTTTKLNLFVTIHGLSHVELSNRYKTEKSLRLYSKYLIQSLVEFSFVSLCPRFIVDTGYVEERLKEYKRDFKIVRMPRCVIIPQGINQRFFELKKSSHKTSNFLSIGAFSSRKGHLKLIEAFEFVLQSLPSFRLDIVGTVSDQLYFDAVRRKILEKGLETSVFLHPNIKNEDLERLLAEARVFVLQTQEESQGIVFCEAMAVGLPIITTNVGGVPYILENETNAFLSSYGDVVKFASHIINLISKPDLEEQMIEENLKKSNLFDWKMIADLVVKEYKCLCQN
jgi:glycosyltransferase involved in cell wall biosynthesis